MPRGQSTDTGPTLRPMLFPLLELLGCENFLHLLGHFLAHRFAFCLAFFRRGVT